MNVRPALLVLAVAFAASLCHAEYARDEPPPESQIRMQSGQNAGHFVQVCFGGLHGGKVIVGESRLVDDDLEITAKACRIDGGRETRVPRSPIIPAGSAAIA